MMSDLSPNELERKRVIDGLLEIFAQFPPMADIVHDFSVDTHRTQLERGHALFDRLESFGEGMIEFYASRGVSEEMLQYLREPIDKANEVAGEARERWF